MKSVPVLGSEVIKDSVSVPVGNWVGPVVGMVVGIVVGIVVGVVDGPDTAFRSAEILEVVPLVTDTLVEYSLYPILATLTWCVPTDRPLTVIGVIPLKCPSR